MQNNYIPNIDISSLVSSDFSDNDYQNVAKEIKKASEEVGFLLSLVMASLMRKLTEYYLPVDISFTLLMKRRSKLHPKNGMQTQTLCIEATSQVLSMVKRD